MGRTTDNFGKAGSRDIREEAGQREEVSALPATTVVKYAPIPGFPGYRAGDDGSIWSCWSAGSYTRKSVITKHWKVLKPAIRKSGHLKVLLKNAEGKSKNCLVHQLILLAFVGPRLEGMESRHFPDRNPANNKKTNLSYSTHSRNMLDRLVHGTDTNGSKNTFAKLHETDIEKIYHLRNLGWTLNQIALHFKTSITTIYYILMGKSWKHVKRPCLRKKRQPLKRNVNAGRESQ